MDQLRRTCQGEAKRLNDVFSAEWSKGSWKRLQGRKDRTAGGPISRYEMGVALSSLE